MFKKFWLALWGWAARWFAHIWVIKYLEEKGMVASEISGTSMGSIIWAFYAFWFSSDKMRDIVSNIKKLDYLKFVDLNFRTWLITWDKLKLKLIEIFWDKKIEDAKIPLKIISVNIDTWEKIIFSSWSIVDAIRSSISIPWIISPYKLWTKDLIDGWVVNNLPIEVLDSENIIAVSVLRDVTRKINTKINVFWFKVQNNFIWINYQILQKTIDIMMKQNEDRSLNCLKKNITLIHPKFPKIDYYEFLKYDKIIKIWYEAALNSWIKFKI